MCVWLPRGEHVLILLHAHVVLSFFHLSVTINGKSYLNVLEVLCCTSQGHWKQKRNCNSFPTRQDHAQFLSLKVQPVPNAKFLDWRVGWIEVIPWSPVPYPAELDFISVIHVICEKEFMLQTYFALPEMKSDISWMSVVCTASH